MHHVLRVTCGLRALHPLGHASPGKLRKNWCLGAVWAEETKSRARTGSPWYQGQTREVAGLPRRVLCTWLPAGTPGTRRAGSKRQALTFTPWMSAHTQHASRHGQGLQPEEDSGRSPSLCRLPVKRRREQLPTSAGLTAMTEDLQPPAERAVLPAGPGTACTSPEGWAWG